MTTIERPNELAANASFELAALELATNYRAALVAEFSPHLRGRVVEVGAGEGHISERLRKVAGVDSLTSIEPDAALAKRFRARLPDIELIEGTIDTLGRDQELDAIVSINVLEHIRDDESELAKYAHLLRERNGRLCLFVPARQEIYAPIDSDFGHHRRYAKPELERKLKTAGFELLAIDYFNLVGYFAWWLSFRVLKKRTFDANAVKLYDSVIFPIVHALETRVARPPIGQSLLVLARPTR